MKNKKILLVSTILLFSLISGFIRTDSVQAASKNEELFDGSKIDLWYGKDNMLLAYKNKQLYLYDVETSSILASTKSKEWDNVNFYSLNNGYAAIGSVLSGAGTSKALCVYYDKNLKETKTVAIDKFINNTWCTPRDVSSDGSMIVYADFSKGLCLYNINTGENTQLLDMSGSYEDRQNILTIDAVFFDEKEENVIFSAQTTKNDKTVESWGKIKLDSSGLENHILDKNPSTAVRYENGKLLFGEDSVPLSARVAYVDVASQKQYYSASIERGSNVGGPVFSETGDYFIVTHNEKNKVLINIYQTKDFKLICQKDISDDNKELFYRMPHIYLMDKLKQCIVCMGGHNDIPLKEVTLDY